MNKLNQDLKIEKGFEMPTVNRHGKFQEIVAKMEVGDSVSFTTLGDANTFSTCMSRNKMRPSRRRQQDGTFRVWRTAG